MTILERMKHFVLLTGISLALVLVGAEPAVAQSSENYILERSVLTGGGGDSTSTRFLGTSTTAPSAPTGEASSENYEAVSGFLTFEIHVGIDIKPFSYPNTIKLGSRGSVSVAILSSEDFDAGTVDPTTITLANSPVELKRNGRPMASLKDVNADGLVDLVAHVSAQSMQLDETDTEAALEAKTFEGAVVTGVDTVKVLP